MSAQTVFLGGFETGDFNPYTFDINGDDLARIEPFGRDEYPQPVAEGSHAARFTLGLPSTAFQMMRN